MKKIALSLLLLISCLYTLAQTEEATTNSGKKVILYADGTWKYKEDKKGDPIKTTKPEKNKTTDKNIPENKVEVLSADCAEKLEAVQDKNNVITTRTRNMIIVSSLANNREIDIYLQKGAKGIISISFRTQGGNDCIGEGNKIQIGFTDGSKTELSNDGPMNCRGESVSNFNGPYGKKKQLQELASKKIKTVKVWTQRASVQQELSVENQDEFIQVLSCLIAK